MKFIRIHFLNHNTPSETTLGTMYFNALYMNRARICIARNCKRFHLPASQRLIHMTGILFKSLLACAAAILVGCSHDDPNPQSKTFVFDFAASDDGWIGGFSDHHDTTTADYNLVFERTTLPEPLNTSKFALKLGGTNRSDDLFMFIKKKIAGLEPNTSYKIIFEIEFASNVPTNRVGTGGSPDAVMMKAGAMLIEPLSIYNALENTFRMNIDQGQQSAEGKDMTNLGTIGVADHTTHYTLITRHNRSKPFRIKTNAAGELWVIAATDSGYESRTELYYNKISITFN